MQINRLLAFAALVAFLSAGSSAGAQETEPATPPTPPAPATPTPPAQQAPPPPTQETPAAAAAPRDSALGRGIAAFNAGDIPTATRELEAAVAANENDPIALSWLGFLLLKGETQDPTQTERAITLLEKSLTLRPDPATQTNLGSALLTLANAPGEAGDQAADRAITFFRKVAEDQPQSVEARINLGSALRRKREYGQAEETYREAIRLREAAGQPEDARLWADLGSVLREQRKTGEAAEAYRRSIAINTDNAASQAALGELELERRNYAAAITALKRARELDPKQEAVLINLGNAYQRTGRRAEAAEAFDAAAALAAAGTTPDPASIAVARFNQGVQLAQVKRFSEAADAYKQALAADPNLFGAHLNLGFIRFNQGRAAEAVANFRNAVRVAEADVAANPQSPLRAQLPLAFRNLAAAASRAGDKAGAATAWRRAARLDPKDYESRALLAGYLLGRGQSAEAIRLYQAAANLRPRSSEAQNALGLAYQRTKNYDAAAAAFKRAIRLDPKNAYAHNNLGVVYEWRAQLSLAIAQYRRALAINPNLADARSNLARFRGQRARY